MMAFKLLKSNCAPSTCQAKYADNCSRFKVEAQKVISLCKDVIEIRKLSGEYSLQELIGGSAFPNLSCISSWCKLTFTISISWGILRGKMFLALPWSSYGIVFFRVDGNRKDCWPPLHESRRQCNVDLLTFYDHSRSWCGAKSCEEFLDRLWGDASFDAHGFLRPIVTTTSFYTP